MKFFSQIGNLLDEIDATKPPEGPDGGAAQAGNAKAETPPREEAPAAPREAEPPAASWAEAPAAPSPPQPQVQQPRHHFDAQGPSSAAAGVAEAPRFASEEEAWELLERLRTAEDKLLDSQSSRDMCAKETDMYRVELKLAREEKSRLEAEVWRAQAQLRELQAAAQARAEPTAAQEAVIHAMQRDFEGRLERHREEAQFIRQKCDEKERRCEQLQAERNALANELRSAGGSATGAAAAWRAPAAEAGAGTAAAVPAGGGDLEAGAAGATATKAGKAAASSRTLVRSLPLASPSWLRNSDEPLRLVVRTLSNYPQARIAFFVYVVLLHVWVLFILQQSAMQ